MASVLPKTFILACALITSLSAQAAPMVNSGAFDYKNSAWNTISYDNLEWLELGATKGQSFDAVSTEAANGSLSGWRYASMFELESLLIDGYGIPADSDPDCQFGSQFCDTSSIPSISLDVFQLGRPNVEKALSDFGATKVISSSISGTSQYYATGMIGDTFLFNGMKLPVAAELYHRPDDSSFFSDNKVNINSTRYPGSTYADTGSFLVRDLISKPNSAKVTEPASVVLLAIGLLALAAARRNTIKAV